MADPLEDLPVLAASGNVLDGLQHSLAHGLGLHGVERFGVGRQVASLEHGADAAERGDPECFAHACRAQAPEVRVHGIEARLHALLGDTRFPALLVTDLQRNQPPHPGEKTSISSPTI